MRDSRDTPYGALFDAGLMRRWLSIAIALAAVLSTTVVGAHRSPSGAAVTPPAENLTSSIRDLGTLGGERSSAADIDGSIVVGSAETAEGTPHAFAYDLTSSTMRDLGTLGGERSFAADIDGNIVVGSAQTAGGVFHAFAYDLTSATIRDLGTLGGDSSATAVDGQVVVGASQRDGFAGAWFYDLSAQSSALVELNVPPAGGWPSANVTSVSVDDGVVVLSTSVEPGQHIPGPSYVYDLNAATTVLRDLGVLPGSDFTEAVDVDGGVVVGSSGQKLSDVSADGHAFAYDLASTTPTLRDLGTLGGPFSFARATDEHVVVGGADISPGVTRPFAYDLDAPRPAMRHLGTLGGEPGAFGQHFATAVDGSLVAGVSAPAGADSSGRHAFAYDLSAADRRMINLGTLGGASSTVTAVQRSRVIGQAETTTPGVERAVVWTVARTTAPALRFARFRWSVQENVSTARVTVTRAGDSTPAVSVRYAATATALGVGGDPIPGKDFRSVRGTLTFASGQTRATLNVPILNDRARERPEEILLQLTAPTGRAILSTPSRAAITIRASDQRPDVWVSTRAATGFIGDNLYNRTGARQTKRVLARRGQTRTLYMRVYNDGNVANTITLRGSRPRPGSTARYHRGRDITGALRSPSGMKLRIGARAHRQIKVTIRVGPRATIGSQKPATLRASWRGDGFRTDLARAAVTVARFPARQLLEWSDPAGDMWHSSAVDEVLRPAPSHEGGDVIRTRVRHSAEALTIRHWFRDVRGESGVTVRNEVRTDKGLRRELSSMVTPDGQRVIANLYNDRVEGVACRGLVARVNARRATTYLRVPRACLGRPRWVRVATHIENYGISDEIWLDYLHGPGTRAAFSSRIWRPVR